MEEEMCEGGRVVLADGSEDEVAVGRWHVQQELEGLDPGLVDLAAASHFVPVAQMKANEAQELVGVAGGERLLQVRDRHVSWLDW